MALSNTAVPKYYGTFRDAVLRGDIYVNYEISLEMNRIDSLIKNPGVYYDDRVVEGWIEYCENELTLTDGSDLELLDNIEEVGNPDMWIKAQPNIGKTVSYETYQLEVERAEKAPAARNDILAKRFGLPMEGYTYFFPYHETLPHKKRDYWGMPCSLGGDLSQGDDFCSFTFMFPLSNGKFGIKTKNYISSHTLMKLPGAMRVKYNQFMDEGSLVVLEGTVLDMMQVYEDLDEHITTMSYDVRCFGYDPYNAKEFVSRWETEYSPYGVVQVKQGAKTESVPLGELKKLSEERMLLFDEELMTFAMGNCIALEDTNGNRKLYKKRHEQKIDAVAAMMDAYIAYKLNKDAFE